MYHENWILAAVTFFCGLATDWIDGALARKLDAATKFGGEVLEPIADVFLVMCGAIGLVVVGLIPWWVLATIIVANRVLDWGIRPHMNRPDRVLWFEAVLLEVGAYGISVFLLWQAISYAGIAAICAAPIIIVLKRRRIQDFTRWCWR
jgi:phosphatidylglycerophosphate synthase